MRPGTWFRLAVISLLFLLLPGCAPAPVAPTSTPVPPTQTPTATSTFTPSRTPTVTPIPPLNILFYGDSVLKVGEVGRQGSVGYSIVDELRPALEPPHTLLVANYGGRNALWGAGHLEENVLALAPDVVTLWWGMNELHGCPGIFDRDTNQMLQYMVDAYLNEHLASMRQLLDNLLSQNIPVYVVTPIPVWGELPWSHFDENTALIWESNHWCKYNLGLEQLAAADRALVEEYAAAGQPVYLVDAWQVYQDNPNADYMYMDVVHPGGLAAELIAAEWLRVFEANQR